MEEMISAFPREQLSHKKTTRQNLHASSSVEPDDKQNTQPNDQNQRVSIRNELVSSDVREMSQSPVNISAREQTSQNLTIKKYRSQGFHTFFVNAYRKGTSIFRSLVQHKKADQDLSHKSGQCNQMEGSEQASSSQLNPLVNTNW